jgi:hypothetical protein
LPLFRIRLVVNMLPIEQQLRKDFKRILNSKETPEITLTYDVICVEDKVDYYGNVSGTTTTKTDTIKAIMEAVDEWRIKKMPYANLRVGQTIFYIAKTNSLKHAKNIKVKWGNYEWSIASVEKAVPLGKDYLCLALVSV